MTEDDLKQIEKLIKRHAPSGSDTFALTILFILFLNGCMKGCGY